MSGLEAHAAHLPDGEKQILILISIRLNKVVHADSTHSVGSYDMLSCLRSLKSMHSYSCFPFKITFLLRLDEGKNR